MGIFAFYPLASPAKAESLSNWASGASYPNLGPPPNTGIQWDSCVAYAGVMYCVGGGNYDTGDSSV
ncbi:MAG TPA: hypothetical protein VFE91_03135, partial [Nitrososphaerales archaeon]|nr:hypothetical protein [Nitrososphaerales archaeon]